MSAAASFRVGLVQMRSGRDPAANVETAAALVRQARAGGAELVLTPEMTNIVNRPRTAVFDAVADEAAEPAVAALAGLAGELGIHLLAGSLALREGAGDLVNRSLLFGPDGRTLARYDKIHMFDVDLAGGESYRESASFRAGERAVVADLPWGRLGLTICYDLRFAYLYRALAQAGADLLAIPAAFTRQTGAAHWHVLMRARAIETGCFVLAPAQGGDHADGRATYGHSLVVSPWGEVIAEADGEEPGVIFADIDVTEVATARRRIPALNHDRAVAMPAPAGGKAAAE